MYAFTQSTSYSLNYTPMTKLIHMLAIYAMLFAYWFDRLDNVRELKFEDRSSNPLRKFWDI